MVNTRLSLLLIVLANLLPVIGVFEWGWDLTSILFLYWAESLVIGIINILRIGVSRDGSISKTGTAAFFTVHYGIFWVVHGVFLISWIVPLLDAAKGEQHIPFSGLGIQFLKPVLLALVISHIASFIMYLFKTRRPDRPDTITQMFHPYGRVFVMHIVILGGASLAADWSPILAVILLFTTVKILFEIFTWFMFDRPYLEKEIARDPIN